MATVHKSPGSSRHRVQFADSEFICSCSWQLCLFTCWSGIQMLLFIAAVLVWHEDWRATWKHPLDHPMGHGAQCQMRCTCTWCQNCWPVALPWDETTELEKRRWTSPLLSDCHSTRPLFSVSVRPPLAARAQGVVLSAQLQLDLYEDPSNREKK